MGLSGKWYPKLLKQIKKSNSVREYKIASDAIFREYN